IGRQYGLMSLLKAPSVAIDIKKKIITLWFKELPMTADISGLLDLLAVHQRLFLFPQIVQQISRLYRKQHGLMLFKMISSAPLTEEQQQALVTSIEKKINATVIYTQQVNKELIAGIRM